MRRKKSEPPVSPLEWGERVKIRTRSGLETTGKISFVGYMPYPGMWSFEVTTDDGQVYKTHGSELPSAAIARLEKVDRLVSLTEREAKPLPPESASEEAPRIEQTEAGAQYVAPGTPPRQVPTSGLRAKMAQKDGPMPLETAAIEGRQGKLF